MHNVIVVLWILLGLSLSNAAYLRGTVLNAVALPRASLSEDVVLSTPHSLRGSATQGPDTPPSVFLKNLFSFLWGSREDTVFPDTALTDSLGELNIAAEAALADELLRAIRDEDDVTQHVTQDLARLTPSLPAVPLSPAPPSAPNDGQSGCPLCTIPEAECNPDHLACTMEYDPVCGCDLHTYSNACVARYFGCVRHWKKGQCPRIE